MIFRATNLFSLVISERTKHKVLQPQWRLTWNLLTYLNLLHVSDCKTLHFVMSYMNQNKKCKQTLESAQYRLEISFKLSIDTVAELSLTVIMLWVACYKYMYLDLHPCNKCVALWWTTERSNGNFTHSIQEPSCMLSHKGHYRLQPLKKLSGNFFAVILAPCIRYKKSPLN